jgi:hypothetical protein
MIRSAENYKIPVGVGDKQNNNTKRGEKGPWGATAGQKTRADAFPAAVPQAVPQAGLPGGGGAATRIGEVLTGYNYSN